MRRSEMPAPLTDEWIKEQLRLCEEAKRGPWKTYPEIKKRLYEEDEVGPWIMECGHDLPGFPYLGAFESEADAELIAAAREGYPATLEALQAAQGELRTVYAILRGLHMAIDAMSHENIKECLGQLLMAGAEWLEKEERDASTE